MEQGPQGRNRRYDKRTITGASSEMKVRWKVGRPLVRYPDVFGTDITCDETDETRSAAQFEDSLVFEERGTSLEKI